MPRIGRVVAVGLPHHITQRGNYKHEVFLDDNDREKYLGFLCKYASQYKLSILTYCLMSNHVHFIAIPEREDSLARMFNTVHMRYSQYFNKKIGAGGHLWQGRFYSCVLDERHLMVAARYVERNPVRAKLVKKPWQWKWSSARVHVGKEVDPRLKLDELFELVEVSCESWREYIERREDTKEMEEIKKHTLTGRPLGTDQFIMKLEGMMGRRLKALPRGRPMKGLK